MGDRYQALQGELRVTNPLFGKAALKVAGRDQTKLVERLAKQVELVNAAIADVVLEVPIRGCFCFVDTELPLFGTLSIKGFGIFGRTRLAKQLNSAGVLTDQDAATLAALLAERFPPA